MDDLCYVFYVWGFTAALTAGRMSFMAVWLPEPRSLARSLARALALLPLRRHFTLTKVESSTTENFAPGGLKGKARRQRRSLRAAGGASACAGPDPPRR